MDNKSFKSNWKKPGDVNAIEAKTDKQKDDKPVDITEKVKHETTLSKHECINLIESKNNIDKLFGITEYKDYIICFHIFEDLYNHKLNIKGYNHKIKFIEEINRTLIKVSMTKDKIIIKEISFSATKELMIALTKNVNCDFYKNALDQYKKILYVCLKLELDKHILKIPAIRPTK